MIKNFVFSFLTVLFLSVIPSCHIFLDVKDNVAVCGNGVIDEGEDCDTPDLNGQTCLSLGYSSNGTLSCNSVCRFNTSDCIKNNTCGNGIIEPGEDCDGTDLNNSTCLSMGFDGGNLKCGINCKYDISDCEGESTCGNGIIEPGEECDGTDLNNLSCEILDFNGGTLSCNNNCMLDTSDCLNEVTCGNGVIDDGEDCDGTNLNENSCLSQGFDNGTLYCKDDCTFDTSECTINSCGNGVLNDSEDCDGTNLNGNSCTELGFYGGNLSCNNNCTFNISDCETYGRCGDGIRQEQYEECDDTDFGDNSCSALGFYDGNLTCNTNCTLNISDCEVYGRCGDGIVNGEELCDNFEFKENICLELGFWWGIPSSCNSECIPDDPSGCHYAVQWGSDSSDTGTSIAVDTDGNIYVAGQTYGSMDGNTNAGGNDIFLTKYNSYGTKLWTRQWGSDDGDTAYGVIVDFLGNVYVTGTTNGNLGGNINRGLNDIFITKLTTDGSILWTRQWGTHENDYATSLSSGFGYVYVAGYTSGDLDGTSNGGYDVFITKISADGIISWTKQWGSTSSDKINDIVTEIPDHIYVTGYTAGDMDGNDNIGSSDVFVSLLTTDGTKIWTKQWGTDASDEGRGITIFNNYVYVTGNTKGSMDGNSNLGLSDAFLTKLSSSGTILWTQQWGTSESEYEGGNDITYISGDGLYIAGYTDGDMDGNINHGYSDIFLTKYNENGTKIWTKQWGTSVYDKCYSVTSFADNIYLTGRTDSSLDDNPGYSQDPYIIRSNP